MVLWRSSRRSNRARRVGRTRCDWERSGTVTEVMPAPRQARRCSPVPTARRPSRAHTPRRQLIGGAPKHDASPVHERHLGAGGPDVFDEVRAHDHRGRLAQLAQHRPELHPLFGVEPGGGLVQQQQLRVVDDGLGDPHPAQHPTREGAQLGLGPFPELDPLHGGSHCSGYPSGGHLLQEREVLDELHDRKPRVIAQVLRQVAQSAADLPTLAVVRRVAAQQLQASRGRLQHGGHHPQQRSLASPVRAEEPEHPGTDLQVDSGHRLGTAELSRQMVDVDVHDAPLGTRVTRITTAAQPAAKIR